MSRRWFSWLAVGAGLAVVLLAANVALTFRNTRQLKEDSAWVDHTYMVIRGLDRVLQLASDAETAERGFLITGEPRYLEPYKGTFAAVNTQIDEVDQLTADNPAQQSLLPDLREHIAAKWQMLDETIALRKTADFETVRTHVLTGRSKREMDAIRDIVGQMTQDEQSLLAARSKTTAQAFRAATLMGLLSGLAAIGALGAFLLLLRWHLAARTNAAFVISEQAERLRTTLASIGDAVIATDAAGRVTMMNGVAELLTGWPLIHAAGQPLDAVFRIVNEETRQTVENPATRALREGAIVGLANHTVLINRSGSETPIDDSAAPIRCKEGELVGCVLVFRDISERKRSEAALRESEERLRMAQQASKIGTFEWNIETGAIRWTPELESMYGLPAGGFSGTQAAWEALVHPDDRPRAAQRMRDALALGEYTDEWRVIWPDGSIHWLAGRGRLFKDAEGQPRRLIGINIDITDRKRVEEELRRLAAELSEADRRKDEFLATLAHELRNPLAPIVNGLQILRLKSSAETAANQSVADQSVADARAMMERQLGHMIHLVDDLLDASRISQGKLELRKERAELTAILNHALETSRPVIEAAGHELSVSLPREPVFVDADVTRLAQVFANLLNNAAKYSDPPGQVWLAAERQGSDVVVSVKDAGVGIPPEMLAKIFDLFMQVDHSLERSQGGLGIGLTLVRRLVEMHGGSVEARSEGRGKGSRFIVRMPVALSAEGGLPLEKTAPASPFVRRRVLIADDNLDSANSLGMLLNIMGHEVHLAADGAQAVEMAAALEPDVVVLDIGMPKLNGYEACLRIRKLPWASRATCIALTGWGQDEDKRRSQEAGFQHHLIKPVDPAALEKLLSGLEMAAGG